VQNLIITKHGKIRTKDRCGLSKKISDKVADRAYKKGIKHSETVGSLKRYLDGIFLAKYNANNMRIYMEKVFLFHDNIFVSILNLPNKYKNTVKNINNKKEDKI